MLILEPVGQCQRGEWGAIFSAPRCRCRAVINPHALCERRPPRLAYAALRKSPCCSRRRRLVFVNDRTGLFKQPAHGSRAKQAETKWRLRFFVCYYWPIATAWGAPGASYCPSSNPSGDLPPPSPDAPKWLAKMTKMAVLAKMAKMTQMA